MTRIEQFWYTRPTRDSGRSPGYQIVAASPGLTGEHGFEVGVASRLCRYDPPAGPCGLAGAPASFGWIDSDDVRYCFRRVPLGVDEHGRPGNFAAHILIGPPNLMPSAALAARLASPWWWHGVVPEYSALPALADIDEVPVGELPDAGPLAERFVEALLQREPGRQIAVHADPALIAALVVVTDDALPGLMDHYALSTHEGPQTARWFDITGSEHPMPGSIPVTDQPDPGTPDEVRRAARLVFSTKQRAAISMAVHAAGIGTRSPDVGSLAAYITAYSGLAAGQVPAMPHLARALNNPTAAGQILSEYPHARDAVAAAVVRGDGLIAESLAAAIAQGLGTTALTELGGAVAGQLMSAPHSSGQWDSTLAALASLAPALHTACLAEMVANVGELPAAVEKMSPQNRVALLWHAAAGDTAIDHPRLRHILEELGPHWRLAVDSTSFPALWRGWALAAAYRMSIAESPSVAGRLLQDNSLMAPFCERVSGVSALLRVLASMPRQEQQRMARDFGAVIGPNLCSSLLEHFSAQIKSAPERLAFLRSCRDAGLLKDPKPGLSPLVCQSAGRQLREGMCAHGIPKLSPDLGALLEWCPRTRSVEAWRAVVSAAQWRSAVTDDLKRVLGKVSDLPDPDERTMVREYVFACFARRRPGLTGFYEAAGLRAFTHRSSNMIALAKACDRVIDATGDRMPAFEFLRCAIYTAARGELSFGKAQDQLLQAAMRRLLSAFDQELRTRLRTEAMYGSEALARWWSSVEESAGARGGFVNKSLRHFGFRR